ncbi:hypothetical protein [Lonepinella sp. MS14436]|uniref:hypothetical protein n=1 Tax=Lonepinella sp. MS14436 TaxID=3003619 RepID=UPI0036DD7CC7
MTEFYTAEELFGKCADNDFILSGLGWGVKEINNRYILSFISGEFHGREKKIEISYDDFYLLKSRKVTINDIFIKYKTG